VSFITLILIPIPMVRELAITASLGVGYKIITNLVMLPLAASLFNFTKEYADKAVLKREQRSAWLRTLARVAEPRNALIVIGDPGGLRVAVWQSHDRVIGTVQPGAPELRADARFNRDAVAIAESYDTGLDWLTVIFEAAARRLRERRGRALPGPLRRRDAERAGRAVGASFCGPAAHLQRGLQRGQPEDVRGAHRPRQLRRARHRDRPRARLHEQGLQHDRGAPVPVRPQGHHDQPRDRRGEGLPRARPRGGDDPLASGNAGVLAAVNDEVQKSELPMMLYVYAAIMVLVALMYRDFRAVVACCLPLTVGTFIGYWFMKELRSA
jgi:predicted RND superfamily exporter protein